MGSGRGLVYNSGQMQRGFQRVMRRAAGWVAWGCLLLVGSARLLAGPLAQVDPALAAWLAAGEAMAREATVGLQTVASPTGEVRVKVLATTSTGSGQSLAGVPVDFATGTVASLCVSRAELVALVGDPRVLHVESSWKTRPAVDVSVPAIAADRASTASPPIVGEGVIVGLVDTGLDVRHLDFRYDADGDGEEEATRVLMLWDQTWGLFGTTYSRSDIEADLASPGPGKVKSLDRDGHGTHVAGIAAGDGSSSTAGLRGVAPGASIIAVKTTFFTADILEAVGFIFDEAERRGMPAVVNLSLGGQEGPHDGTSAFERGLDELAVGPGRAIVVSAGNEGDIPIHVSGFLQGGSRSFDLQAGGRELTLEIWYTGASRFTVTVTAPSGATISAAAGSASGFVTTPDGVAYIDNSAGGPNVRNGDREVLIRVTNTTAGTVWRVSMTDAGGGGRFDGWITSSTGRVRGGDSTSTIDEPGNARNVVTVGALNSKAVWPSQIGLQDDSDEVEVGLLSPFSSQGPTRDGRTKPDLVAPGTWICAALSSAALSFADLTHPDGVHSMHRGTSMAAPHVSGVIALLFDVNPRLTSTEITALLTSTTTREGRMGAVPNMRWGFGRVDAWAALQRVLASEPPPPSGDRPSVAVEKNPSIDQAVFAYGLPEGTRSAALYVYDVVGRRVLAVPLSVSASDYVWDLVSDAGARVAPGLYLYVVTSDRGRSLVGRLVVSL